MVKLDLYKLYWWKPIYTSAGLVFLFWLSKAWFRGLNKVHGRLLSFITILSILYGLRIQFSLLNYAFINGRKYTVHWIEALGRDSTAINSLVALFIAIIFSFLVLYNYKFIWKLTAIILFFLRDKLFF